MHPFILERILPRLVSRPLCPSDLLQAPFRWVEAPFCYQVSLGLASKEYGRHRLVSTVPGKGYKPLLSSVNQTSAGFLHRSLLITRLQTNRLQLLCQVSCPAQHRLQINNDLSLDTSLITTQQSFHKRIIRMRLSSAFVSIPAVLAFCGVAIAAPLEPRAADQCTTAGTMICNADLTQFALCNPPAAPIWQAVAPGTTCTPTGGSPAAPGVAPPNGAPVPPVVPVVPPAVKPSSNVGGEAPLESPLDDPPLVPTVNPGAFPSATGIKQAASPAPSGGIAAGGDATSTTDVAAAVSAIPFSAKDTILASTFGGTGSKPIYGSKAKGKKRSIAYYQLSDGVAKGAAGDNYESFKGLTHLILFSVNMNVTLPKLDLALERTWPSDVISKVRAQDTAVMAAFGGWAMDELYKGLDSSMEAIELGVRIADFAIDNGLDGVGATHLYIGSWIQGGMRADT